MAVRSKKSTNIEFTWEGVNTRGNRLEGTIAAKNISAAKAQLRRKGILVKKLKRKTKLLASLNKKTIKPADIATFSRQLATMIAAGIPLVQSLDIVAKGLDNPTLAELVTTIKKTVESGSPFAEALSKHPKYFDSLFCNLIDAGEQSGTLDVMLERIATYREKTESVKKKIRKALSYPIAVLVIAFAVTTILMVKVIPEFETLFSSVGGELPGFTQTVIHISEFFQSYWYVIVIGLIILITTFILGRKRSEKFRRLSDTAFLKIPIFGKLLQKAAIARFCRTLATTFAAGMPLVNALNVSSKAAGNLAFQQAIIEIKDSVSSGDQFHYAMNATKRFPNMIVQMSAIGEESGELDAMMNKAASIFEEDVDTTVDSLSSLLEPAIMAILGVLVGGLVIAMYLPIFQMGQAF